MDHRRATVVHAKSSSNWSAVDSEDRRNFPAYGVAEAAHYLRLPYPTLRSWIRRQSYRTTPDRARFDAPIVLPDPNCCSLSFFNLVEAHVLRAIQEHRRIPRVPLPRIYFALSQLRRDMPHPLVREEFRSDGIDRLISGFQGVVPIPDGRRTIMRRMIRAYLDRIEYDSAGLAVRLYPFIDGEQLDEPKSLMIDSNVAFGRPTLRGTGMSSNVIAERHRAGDSIQILAEDYDCKSTQIEQALRCEETLAA